MHIGPDAAHVFERTGADDRLEQALAVDTLPRELASLDDRIEQLEQARANLLVEQYELEHSAEYRIRAASNVPSRDGSPDR